MRREAEHAFRTHYGLSAEQYQELGKLHNNGEVGDINTVYRCSLPQPVPETRPDFVERYFTVPDKICCGKAMKARPIEAP